jgi:glucosamine-6-phosphate deaminase
VTTTTDSNQANVFKMMGPEKIRLAVYDHGGEASRAVAGEIAELIRAKQAAEEKCVLGLATGSTPTGVYAELIRMHKEEGLSFAHVISFNLDEYFPMDPVAIQSYQRFMNEHLFDHIDIDPKNAHLPDGTLAEAEVADHCAAYEQAIDDAGGIDLQLLGIGRTGHIGFNEPGSGRYSRTRLISLDQVTCADAASDFFGIEHVPRRAITMGVQTILKARRVVLMAFGEGKAEVVRRAVEEPISDVIAGSYLQDHPDASIVLDHAAADRLTRIASPWVVRPLEWTADLRREAVLWVAQRTSKAILKLTDEDYNENHLQDLLAEHGPAERINLEVFRYMQLTITGWPGGKPAELKQEGDVDRPTDQIFPKRILIFSPHPDDDVISMGGTLIRLADQGHEVHVAYQVSGAIAVFDEDAIRFADFAADFNALFDIDRRQSAQIEGHIERFLKGKKPGEVDSPEVQKLKSLIRRGEARAAARSCGVEDEYLHFLDMPFYETGTVRKKPLGEEDVKIVVDLLNEVKPHQVYAAGDLSDPHGTHRTCLAAIAGAMGRVRDEAWFADCEAWLYRGAWQEWEPEKIDMAVPISPREMARKRQAIFKHESQKDRAMFPGSDSREFWQRAEQRNHGTAELYDNLGLAEYEAIEAFARWGKFDKFLG